MEEKRLAEMGFVLHRQKNHPIWKHKDTGKILVLARSGSDWRGAKNAFSEARKVAGIESPSRAAGGPENARKQPLPPFKDVRAYAEERGLRITANQARALLRREGGVKRAKAWIDRATARS